MLKIRVINREYVLIIVIENLSIYYIGYIFNNNFFNFFIIGFVRDDALPFNKLNNYIIN